MTIAWRNVGREKVRDWAGGSGSPVGVCRLEVRVSCLVMSDVGYYGFGGDRCRYGDGWYAERVKGAGVGLGGSGNTTGIGGIGSALRTLGDRLWR